MVLGVHTIRTALLKAALNIFSTIVKTGAAPANAEAMSGVPTSLPNHHL